MSRFEGPLISRIVDTGDIASARHLPAEFFFLPESRAAWSYVQEYNTLYGEPPSREMLTAHVPAFRFESAFDPVPALVQQVEEFHTYNFLNGTMERLAEMAKTDVAGAAAFLADQAMELRSLSAKGKGSGVELTSLVQSEMDEYYRRKNLKGLLGMSWPWPRLNRATFGLQPGQFVVFYARPKNLKSFLLIYVVEHCHYQHKCRPVIFTREMSAVELRRRYCATWAKIDYDHYLRGCLSTADEIRWKEALEAFAESPPVWIESVAESGAEAADAMIARAQELDAGLIAVDGIYFFGNREWDQIAAFTSRLKYHLLNTWKIPCIGTSQGTRQFSHGKKGASKSDDVGYSDAILQDVDVLIKCAYVKEDQRLYLSLPAIREGQDCEFQVHAKPCFDFSQAFCEEGHEAEISQANAMAEDDLLHV